MGCGGGESKNQRRIFLCRIKEAAASKLPTATPSSDKKLQTYKARDIFFRFLNASNNLCRKDSTPEEHNGWPCLGDWLRVVTTLSCSCLCSVLPWAWTESYLILPKPSRHNSHLTSPHLTAWAKPVRCTATSLHHDVTFSPMHVPDTNFS